MLFSLYFYFSKVKINFFDIYLIPCVLLCFYIEPSLYTFEISIKILSQSVWAITAFVIGVVIYNEITCKRLIFKNIIFFIFIGSLIHFLIIFFFNIFIFEFPITRNGFIHPFTRINNEHLIFNLENIKKVNPINIRSLYVVLEIMFTCSTLLSIFYKKKSYLFHFLNIIIFIIGCSFGSRLFVIYFLAITLLSILISPSKKIWVSFLIINILIFFNNITIYSFIDKENYIRIFNNNFDNFKKLKSYQIQFSDINKFLISSNNHKLTRSKIYIEDNFIFFNNQDNISHVIKFSPENLKYLKKNNLNYFKSDYENSFTVNYNTWDTSHKRFFEEQEKKNLFNRFKIIKTGFNNLNDIILGKNIEIKNNLNDIIIGDEIIYHNFLLDTLNQGSYLGVILIILIYFKIINFIFISHKNKSSFIILLILSYFVYDQFIQTSILTSKNSIFLFNVIFVSISAYLRMNRRELNFFLRSNF